MAEFPRFPRQLVDEVVKFVSPAQTFALFQEGNLAFISISCWVDRRVTMLPEDQINVKFKCHHR